MVDLEGTGRRNLQLRAYARSHPPSLRAYARSHPPTSLGFVASAQFFFSTKMSKVRKGENEEEDDDENQRVQIPDHLIRVLDGLAQEDDDLELDQAAVSLTACIGKGRHIKACQFLPLLNRKPQPLNPTPKP